MAPHCVPLMVNRYLTYCRSIFNLCSDDGRPFSFSCDNSPIHCRNGFIVGTPDYFCIFRLAHCCENSSLSKRNGNGLMIQTYGKNIYITVKIHVSSLLRNRDQLSSHRYHSARRQINITIFSHSSPFPCRERGYCHLMVNFQTATLLNDNLSTLSQCYPLWNSRSSSHLSHAILNGQSVVHRSESVVPVGSLYPGSGNHGAFLCP